MKAILVHERCHIRCHDNLVAAIHMLVEAIFWFHPLVWWIGARLVEERERACDEEVLRRGADPEAYAAGAVVYATQRPNPNPRVFGYHEVFHALVIAAAAAHFTAIAFFALPAA